MTVWLSRDDGKQAADVRGSVSNTTCPETHLRAWMKTNAGVPGGAKTQSCGRHKTPEAESSTCQIRGYKRGANRRGFWGWRHNQHQVMCNLVLPGGLGNVDPWVKAPTGTTKPTNFGYGWLSLSGYWEEREVIKSDTDIYPDFFYHNTSVLPSAFYQLWIITVTLEDFSSLLVGQYRSCSTPFPSWLSSKAGDDNTIAPFQEKRF